MQKLPDRPFIAPPSGLGPEGSINNAGCHVNYMGTLPEFAENIEFVGYFNLYP
jgi:hypothetical protein